LNAARTAFEEGLRISGVGSEPISGYLSKVASTLRNLGTVYHRSRELDTAQVAYEKRWQLPRAGSSSVNASADVALVLNNLHGAARLARVRSGAGGV